MVKRILGLSLLMVAGLVGCGGPDVGPSSAELDGARSQAQGQLNCCYQPEVCNSSPFDHYGACAQIPSINGTSFAAYGAGGCDDNGAPHYPC